MASEHEELAPANDAEGLDLPMESSADGAEAKDDGILGVEDWVELLNDEEMPLLAQTVKQLKVITNDEEARVSQLAQAILNDPSLTARILRIANSVQYKGFESKVTTISRAIVLLGFTTIRDICLSMRVIDSLLGDKPSEQLLSIMARSFHGAMQAKALVENLKPVNQEEVFISTLLYRIGEAAFWSCGGEYAEELEARISVPGTSVEQACEDVLGFKFESLTGGLAKSWQVGDLLVEALSPNKDCRSLAKIVRFGDQISGASIYGWDSPEMKDVLEELKEFTGEKSSELYDRILDTAELSKDLAGTYGVGAVKHLIPSKFEAPDNTVSDSGSEKGEAATTESAEAAAEANKPVGNPELQLSILGEMMTLVSEKADINQVLQMAIEGMHRGVGLDRVALCILTPDRKSFKVKYLLGGDQEWAKQLSFPLDRENAFAYAVRYGDPLWMGSRETATLSYLHTHDMVRVIGKGPFFVAPLKVGHKVVGIFFGDRREHKDVINEAMFNAFKQFLKQTCTCLTVLTSR